MSERLGFYFDQSLCTGCKACQIACKDKHDTPVGVNWRRVVEFSGGSWQVVGDTFSPRVLPITRRWRVIIVRIRFVCGCVRRRR